MPALDPESVASQEPKFAFGENWSRFVSRVDETRIQAARSSLQQMLQVERLEGVSFLDAGCGSGLFSLAAAQLGARVHSFDIDPQSLAATRAIQQRFGPAGAQWQIESGSLLDAEFLSGLGEFEIAYSWGVVHHTGDMWRAIDLLQQRVAPAGVLWLAVYNDQEIGSRAWIRVKRLYNALPSWLRMPYVLVVGGGWLLCRLLRRIGLMVLATLLRVLSGRSPLEPAASMYGDFCRSQRSRGMHWWYDLVDWIGGWPFEVAKPEAVFDFLRARGFELVRLKTCGGGLGCNEFVFRRRPAETRAV
jgi:2-polyprenyl-6-hydroxyphenyl methylase/3-demethylubiquinone-9 3-methyltransferase